MADTKNYLDLVEQVIAIDSTPRDVEITTIDPNDVLKNRTKRIIYDQKNVVIIVDTINQIIPYNPLSQSPLDSKLEAAALKHAAEQKQQKKGLGGIFGKKKVTPPAPQVTPPTSEEVAPYSPQMPTPQQYQPQPYQPQPPSPSPTSSQSTSPAPSSSPSPSPAPAPQPAAPQISQNRTTLLERQTMKAAEEMKNTLNAPQVPEESQIKSAPAKEEKNLVLVNLSLIDQIADLEKINDGINLGIFTQAQLQVIIDEVNGLNDALKMKSADAEGTQKDLISLRNQRLQTVRTRLGLGAM